MTRTRDKSHLVAATLLIAASAAIAGAAVEDTLDRTSLPIVPPVTDPITVLDARDAPPPPPPFQIKAPAGAPNVVVVMLDDIGFGTAAPFGGPIATPTMSRLADNGLRFNQFHTTALCSPTRVALLCGRNHHSANAGSVMEIATGYPGNQGQRTPAVAFLAEMLRMNGYSTAAFGKWHETAPWEVSVSGPFDRWPTHSGFDKFYGFIGGETNQWAPFLFDGTTPVEIPDDPDYHLTPDLATKAIDWMRFQHALTPDKPFYVYLAPGATHAPHHVPQEWIDKYKGMFDEGWDVYRERTLARQIELGVVPPNTKLTPKPDDIEDWKDLSEVERKVYARQMELFAAFAEHTDHEIGRIVDALEEMGELDNTLFVYIWGDNGCSAEGGLTGTFNELFVLNGLTDSIDDQVENLDKFGGPHSYNHFSCGWAHAGNTPFQWTKQVASHYGGTRNPVVVHWPAGIDAKGEIRSQWHHVTDVAPTIMEAAGLPFPKTVNGVEQKPFEGTSMVYCFDDADAADRHTRQYFEIVGNRAMYLDGWAATAKHRTPWVPTPDCKLADDVWELYHVAEDFSQSNDVAAQYPEKLAELQKAFLEDAVKYNVLPLDDRAYERFNPAIAGRPDLMGGRTELTLYPGMDRITENTFINVKNRDHTITAMVEIPEGGGDGVLLAQGGRFAGWSLYFDEGVPVYTYNWFGKELTSVRGPSELPPGSAEIRFEFDYQGGKRPGGPATGTLFVDGEKVGEVRFDHTVGAVFAADETADVGMDLHTPVSDDYPQHGNEFNGTIEKIVVKLQ